MTAYVHIGSEKTGTTTIQHFLSQNRDLLEKYQYFYSKSLGMYNSQWSLPFLAYKELRKDEYCLNRSIFTNKSFLESKQNIIADLKSEMAQSSAKNNAIFSSEHISSRICNKVELENLRQILNDLGFEKIIIIFYIREQAAMINSSWSTYIKVACENKIPYFASQFSLGHFSEKLEILNEIFGKENLIVRLFDKNEFKDGDLLKDFVNAIGLNWNDDFIIPPKQNESLDLMGFELFSRINQKVPFIVDGKINRLRNGVGLFRYFQSKDPYLKFQPPKEIMQSYIDYFEESNEWVRKEFFPHKERLFPKKDLSNYKENYELKEMKPEYWDKIAEFIADIVKTKNQIIQNKDNQIAIINNEKSNLQTQINQLQNTLNSLPIKKQQLEISNLEQDLINKKLQTKQLERQLGIVSNDAVISNDNKITIIHPNSAKSRIQNHLSYKLGQAMIINSKNICGILFMPVCIISTLLSHRQEKKIYQSKIKKNPNLKLPSLESYPDYKEALKEKECLTYKLGEALIRANKTWYKGGYVKLWFEIRKLKKEFKKK